MRGTGCVFLLLRDVRVVAAEHDQEIDVRVVAPEHGEDKEKVILGWGGLPGSGWRLVWLVLGSLFPICGASRQRPLQYVMADVYGEVYVHGRCVLFVTLIPAPHALRQRRQKCVAICKVCPRRVE